MWLHSLTKKRLLFIFHSLNNYHVLPFWPLIPQYQSWSQVCLNPLTYTWHIESGVFSCPCQLVEIEGLKRDGPHEKTWTWLRKGNFKRETESLLIAAQNNAIRMNHIKARIDKTQQNSKCRLCGDKDGSINHIISECSKLPQREYKARHDWVGKVIHSEMCKKFKFDHTTNGICTTQHLSKKMIRINSYGTLIYKRIT